MTARARWLREDGGLTLLLLLCVCGAGLRCYGLETQSLWLDELESWSQSREPSVARVIERVQEDVHAPLHPLVLFAVQRCCGDSEAWLRLPSAVAGVLGIAALYLLVRRLYGPPEAAFAALLLTFGETPIYYSQAARPYALLLLGACASGFFCVGALRQLRSGATLGLATRLGFTAAAIATGYTHYFGALLVALQCLTLLLLGRAPARALALVAPVALAGLPWLPAILEDAGRERFWIREPDLHTLHRTWKHWFRRPGEIWTLGYVLCAWFLARRLAAGWRARGPALLRALPDSPTGLVLLWLVAPVAIAFAASKLWLPVYTARNLIVALPAAYALTARALTQLVPTPRGQRLAGVALALALLTGTVFTGHYYTRVRHPQYREAAAALARHEADGPGALVVAVARHTDYFDYYLARNGARSRVELLVTRAGIEAPLREIDARDPERLWLLTGIPAPPDALLAALDARFQLVRHEALHQASARLYRRR